MLGRRLVNSERVTCSNNKTQFLFLRIWLKKKMKKRFRQQWKLEPAPVFLLHFLTHPCWIEAI